MVKLTAHCARESCEQPVVINYSITDNGRSLRLIFILGCISLSSAYGVVRAIGNVRSTLHHFSVNFDWWNSFQLANCRETKMWIISAVSETVVWNRSHSPWADCTAVYSARNYQRISSALLLELGLEVGDCPSRILVPKLNSLLNRWALHNEMLYCSVLLDLKRRSQLLR